MREVADVTGATGLVAPGGKRRLNRRDLCGDAGGMPVTAAFAMIAVGFGVGGVIRRGAPSVVELMGRLRSVRVAFDDTISRAVHTHKEHGNYD